MARLNKAKLPTRPASVTAVGSGRVRPADCFSAEAQTISKRPAIRR